MIHGSQISSTQTCITVQSNQRVILILGLIMQDVRHRKYSWPKRPLCQGATNDAHYILYYFNEIAIKPGLQPQQRTQSINVLIVKLVYVVFIDGGNCGFVSHNSWTSQTRQLF
jgi:hypothetical protein